MKKDHAKLVLIFITLAAAGISPNLFVAAQAGYALMSDLAVQFLIPSILIIIGVLIYAFRSNHQDLGRQILVGLVGGLLGTVGLEVVRHIGFLMGGMPGEMPKLLGVLILNRFAQGPNALSNLVGWSYHFWNGATFGIIYSLLFGRGKLTYGILYAILIGVGFMAGLAALAMGVGRFGVDFGIGFPLTVTLAHLAFGSILGWYVYKKNENAESIICILKAYLKSAAVSPSTK